MRCLNVVEQNGSCMGAVDVEPARYHCSTGVMAAGSGARGKCMPQTVLDSGSSISIIGKAGLGRLQSHFPGLPTVYLYERGSSATIADGRGANEFPITQTS